MNNPFISILISCYNYGKYANRCLTSCLNQTYKDFEIIIVDDASTDNSVEVINSFIEGHKELPIKLICIKENGGPAVAKSTALKSANGKYVMFVDCDDWLDENCLFELSKTALATDADKIKAQARTIDELTGKLIRVRKIPNKTNTWAEGMMYATLMKRQVIIDNNIEFPDDRNVSDDLYFIAQFNGAVKNTEYVRKTVYSLSYKSNSDSGIGNFNIDKKVKYSYRTNEEISKLYKDFDSSNRIGCEYLFAKQYFYLLLQYCRTLDFCNVKNYHSMMLNTIKPFFPKFYNNKNIKLTSNGDPFLFRFAVYICAVAEKTKTMNLLLYVYWLFSKCFNIVTR